MAGFFWFLIGAGSATIWGQHKQWHEQHPEVGSWSNWNDRRKGISCPSQRPTESTPQVQNEAQTEKAPPTPAPAYQDAMMQQQSSFPQQSTRFEWQPWGSWGSRQQQESFKQWDERDFQKMRTKAQDAMADMGEATLDTLMATILAAKTKLAEQKAQRDEKH